LIPKHLSFGKNPGRNPYSDRFIPAITNPAKIVRKVTPSAAPSKPDGPAGKPEPVLILVIKLHASIPKSINLLFEYIIAINYNINVCLSL
jgi:hypothetical protein